MDFRILGPLEAEKDGRLLTLGGSKQRAVLALLLLHANQVVPRNRLIDELWGERAPETAATALQGYVSGLRKALGAERIVTRAPGYLLQIEPDALDLGRFERLVREGRDALAAGDARQASEKLTAALALWRGTPLADLDATSLAYAESLRLQELRLSALEDKFEAKLALGHHAEIVAELESLASQHPLREKLRGQLMLALYRCGRQAEALEAYKEARRLLVGELGLEPGAGLRGLEQAILNHDPALEPPPARAAMRAHPRLRTVAALGVLVIAAAVASAAVLLMRSDRPPTIVPNSLVKIDPRTHKVTDVVRVGRFPGKVASGSGFVWVVNVKDETLTRLGVRSGRADTRGGLRLHQPAGLAADGHGGLWVGSFENNELARIDTKTFAVVERLKVPGRTSLFVAVGAGSLWVTQPPAAFVGFPSGAVSRVDLATRAVEKRFTSPPDVLPGQIAFGHGAAWVENVGDASVWRIDAATNRVARISVGNRPTDIAVAYGSVWVPSSGKNAVWRINAVTNEIEAIIPVGRQPLALAAGGGGIWVTNQADGTVSRIDPRTNRVANTIRLGFNPHGVAVADGAVWVAVARGFI